MYLFQVLVLTALSLGVFAHTDECNTSCEITLGTIKLQVTKGDLLESCNRPADHPDEVVVVGDDGEEIIYEPGGNETPEEIEETPDEDMEAEITGMDCPGNTLDNLDICYTCCAQECLRRPECMGFVYSLWEDAEGVCLLKEISFCDNKIPQPKTSAYKKVITYGVTTKTRKSRGGWETWEQIVVAPAHYYLLEINMDCTGHSIRGKNLCMKCCARQCDKLGDCSGFTYTLEPDNGNHYCTFKTKGVCENPQPVHRNNTMVYIKDSPETLEDLEQTPEYYELATNVSGINCPENDLKSIDKNFRVCCRVCLYNPECVGVVYSINEDVEENCILKHTSICEDGIEYQAGTVAYRKLVYLEHEERTTITESNSSFTFEQEEHDFD